MGIDVALVNPGKVETQRQAPFNIAYLAAFLQERGKEVAIVDQAAGENFEKKLLELNPKFVGVTGTTMVINQAYEIADFARKNLDAKVIIGGKHATMLPQEALQHCDQVVIDEGELAFEAIVQGKELSKIVSYPFIQDIDAVPKPAWELFDMDYYLASKDRIVGKKLRSGWMLTSRGCPFKCIFCHNSFRQTPVRYHSAERVVEELKDWKEKYKVKGIYYADDEFTANKPRLRKIIELMRKEGLDDLVWECQVRVDTVDLETLKLIRSAGCVQVSFGFESGSQRILQMLKNNTTTVEQNRNAVKMCNEAGLDIHGLFMIGSPTETLEDVEMTEKFIDENPMKFVSVFITTPFPGTKLWQMCEEKGLVPKNPDWSKFTTGDAIACDTIPLEKLQQVHNRLNAKYALRNYSKLQLLARALRHPKTSLNYLASYLKGGKK